MEKTEIMYELESLLHDISHEMQQIKAAENIHQANFQLGRAALFLEQAFNRLDELSLGIIDD